MIAKRSHLFPCRTQPLSSSALMVVGGFPCKSRTLPSIFYPFHSSSVVEQSAVNRSVVGSNPTCGANGELSEWSKEHDWKSCVRSTLYRGFESLALRHFIYTGPLVKWLRHRPFTAVTRVRIPYGSPLLKMYARKKAC